MRGLHSNDNAIKSPHTPALSPEGEGEVTGIGAAA
jgi:hypothetical protein